MVEVELDAGTRPPEDVTPTVEQGESGRLTVDALAEGVVLAGRYPLSSRSAG